MPYLALIWLQKALRLQSYNTIGRILQWNESIASNRNNPPTASSTVYPPIHSILTSRWSGVGLSTAEWKESRDDWNSQHSHFHDRPTHCSGLLSGYPRWRRSSLVGIREAGERGPVVDRQGGGAEGCRGFLWTTSTMKGDRQWRFELKVSARFPFFFSLSFFFFSLCFSFYSGRIWSF